MKHASDLHIFYTSRALRFRFPKNVGEGCLVILLADGASYSLPYKGEKDFRTYIEKTYGKKNVIATTTAEFDISIESLR